MSELTIQTNRRGVGIYVRSSSEQSRDICSYLDRSYNGHSIPTVSGIHAISTIIKYALMKNNWRALNVVCGNELYCDTNRVFREMNKMYSKITCIKVDPNKDSHITSAITKTKSEPTVLFLESCSNPSGQILNFDAIKRWKGINRDLLVVIDNTWLTHVILNPLDYGADVVVQSMSKHYSGGNCISGAIISKDKSIKDAIFNMFRVEGVHFSVLYGDVIAENLPLLETRVQSISDTTRKVIKLFRDKAKDIRVIHPALMSHPSHARLEKFFKSDLIPGIVLLELKAPKKIAVNLMKKSGIPYKTSFGGSHAKFDPWPFERDEKTYCRLAIGYDESFDDIIFRLEKFIDSYQNNTILKKFFR